MFKRPLLALRNVGLDKLQNRTCCRFLYPGRSAPGQFPGSGVCSGCNSGAEHDAGRKPKAGPHSPRTFGNPSGGQCGRQQRQESRHTRTECRIQDPRLRADPDMPRHRPGEAGQNAAPQPFRSGGPPPRMPPPRRTPSRGRSTGPRGTPMPRTGRTQRERARRQTAAPRGGSPP